MEGIERVVLVGPKYRIEKEFPILTSETDCLFLATSTENSFSCSKSIAALKHTLKSGTSREDSEEVSECVSWGLREEKIQIKV